LPPLHPHAKKEKKNEENKRSLGENIPLEALRVGS